MAHKTLIGGTAYEIKGGRTLIGGTGYDVKSGRTLVGGTGYDVSFARSLTLTYVQFTSQSSATGRYYYPSGVYGSERTMNAFQFLSGGTLSMSAGESFTQIRGKTIVGAEGTLEHFRVKNKYQIVGSSGTIYYNGQLSWANTFLQHLIGKQISNSNTVPCDNYTIGSATGSYNYLNYDDSYNYHQLSIYFPSLTIYYVD